MKTRALLLLFLMVALLPGCSKDDGTNIDLNLLVGTWKSSDGSGDIKNATVTFYKDGTCDLSYSTLLDSNKGKTYLLSHSFSGGYTVTGYHIYFENYSSAFTLEAKCTKLTDSELKVNVSGDSGNYKFDFVKME